MVLPSRRPGAFRLQCLAATIAAVTPVALAVVFGTGIVAAPSERAIDSVALERFVRDYRARVHLPGVAIVVTKGKAIIEIAGFGEDSRGLAITPQTMMPIASLSKSFTAMAVMQLVDTGKVRLDAPVREYLADFTLADPRAARITVRQLLNHTSGMADATFPEKSGPLPESLAAGVALLRRAPLAGDLAQWLILQKNDGQAANGSRIISAARVGEMHQRFGWSMRTVGDLREIEHSGWMFTFTAHQILLPDTGYGIAVLSNVGLGLAPVDSEEISHALAEMTAGKTPDPTARTGLIVDVVLASLTLLALVLGVRALSRVAAWADRHARRPAWRNTLALVPRLLPVAVLLGLPAILSVVFGGRDGSWRQLLYLAPSLVIWLAVASLLGLAIITTRGMQLARPRRQIPRSET